MDTDLKKVVLRAIARPVADRFPSARRLARAIQTVLRVKRVEKSAARRRIFKRTFLVAGALALAVLIFAAIRASRGSTTEIDWPAARIGEFVSVPTAGPASWTAGRH